MQRLRQHTTPRSGLLARATRRVVGSVGPATLTLAGLVFAAASSAAFDLNYGKGGTDPTVGTLPMTGGDPGFDQAITLRGDLGAVRAAVRNADGLSNSNVAPEFELTDLGAGEVWVRFYGDMSLELDLEALADVEVGLFGGFDGDGMGFVVDASPGAGSTAGSTAGSVSELLPGYELDIDPLRLFDAGLTDGPVVLRALHRSGNTSRIGFDFDPATLRLTIVQDV